jgi:hypothetical protein
MTMKLPRPAARATGRFTQWVCVNDRAARVITILVFAVLVLLGITTSSIGISELRQDPANPLGWQFGNSRPIRSDEIHAYSAIVISILATHGAPSLSPLAARADLIHRFPTDGFFEQFVFFDSTMLRASVIVPESMLFAAHWWLPSLILLLALPTWFHQLGRSRRYGWLAAILIVLSPSSAWWSLMPVALIAYTVGGSVLMIAAFQRFGRGQRVLPVAMGVVGGILIAGLPTFYAPWSLMLSPEIHPRHGRHCAGFRRRHASGEPRGSPSPLGYCLSWFKAGGGRPPAFRPYLRRAGTRAAAV